jgi:hypothetical protein
VINMTAEYPLAVWREALEAAEVWDFCPIDTQENTPGDPGRLGAWISDELRGHDVAGPEGQEERTTVTEEMLHAAFNVLGDDRDTFSPSLLAGVLCTYRGETVDDFKVLAEEYAEDDYTGPDNPAETGWDGFDSEAAYEIWYIVNAIPDGEVCASGSEGGTLYWFNRHDLKHGW